ncbi:phosphoribosylformylglycinamidine synthase subunit PurQ [Pseudomonas aeruginosa]|nr:phosphoribosylformylglycinamidine synthase subunit PurQ [Pseudomonas aeruginosa]
MAGSRLPIAIAHGEGHAEFGRGEALLEADLFRLRVAASSTTDGKVTEAYPANSNGSPRGITGPSSRDGRVTIMMPHPERVFRAVQKFLASGRLAGRRRLAAHVPQRPGPGWTDPAWRAMRTQLVARPSSRGSPGLSRRHLAALYLRGFGFASRLSRRLPQA